MTEQWHQVWTNDVGPDDDYYREFFEIRDSQQNKIAEVEREDHAALIAAAPDLLRVLEHIVANHVPEIVAIICGDGWTKDAIKAVSRARGLDS